MKLLAFVRNASRFGGLALVFAGSLLAQRNVAVSVANNDLTGSGAATIVLTSQGDENALGFTVTFDPMVLRLEGTSNGADVTGATVHVNTRQATSGRVGVVLGLASGSAFAPGQRVLVELKFAVLASSRTNTAIGFADAPVAREVSDPRARVLTATYTGVTVSAGTTPPGGT